MKRRGFFGALFALPAVVRAAPAPPDPVAAMRYGLQAAINHYCEHRKLTVDEYIKVRRV